MSTKAQQVQEHELTPSNGELPDGWASATVLELAELIRGVSYEKGEASTIQVAGRVALLRANNIADRLIFSELQYVPAKRVSADQVLRVGDVVLAMSSGSKNVVGKAASLDKPWSGTFGAFCGVLRPSQYLDKGYFSSFFTTREYRDAISKLSAGVNINNLKREYFAEIELPICPVSEQQRIASKIEALRTRVDVARQELNRAAAYVTHFRQAVLAAACSGRLTEDWRVQHSDVEPASALVARTRSELGRVVEDDLDAAMGELELADIPDSWTWAPTAHIGAVRGGIQKQPKRAPKKNAYPYLRVANVLRDRLELAEIHQMELFGNELQTYKLEPGDLLVVEGNGSLNEIGRSALWSGEIENCVHQNHIIRVRLRGCLPEFVNAYWNSPLGIASIAQVAVTTAGLYSLSTQKIARIPVPVPPLEEQEEIVRRVEALFKLADAIEKRVAAATVRAERLTQAVLAKAFRGELVPTEADLARREGREYEPASVLLERIKAEREKAAEQRIRPNKAKK